MNLQTPRNIVADLRILAANHKNLRAFAKEKYLNENEEAVIDIYLDGNEIYSPYSNPEDPEISEDFISYLESQAYYIPIQYPLVLRLHSSEKVDEGMLAAKLHEHYWKELADKDDDLRTNRLITIILSILGVLLLTVYFIFEFLPEANLLFSEVFSIAGSFAIWEAIDYGFLNRGAIRIQKLNTMQLALSRIEQERKE